MNNTTQENDDEHQTIINEQLENELDNEDTLTKPKKYNYYKKKDPQDDKRRVKERTPKQLEALKKGREKIKERTDLKKKQIIEKYLDEQKSKENTIEKDIANEKENNKKEDVVASSSEEEEIIVKTKNKKKALNKKKKQKIKIYLSDSSDSDSSDEEVVYVQPKKSRVQRPQQIIEKEKEIPKIDYRSYFI